MSKKHLSDVTPQDLMLKWQFEDEDGVDIYAVHTLEDYKIGANPLAIIGFQPGHPLAPIEWFKKSVRLQSIGPTEPN
jgi:hypothetical protein